MPRVFFVIVPPTLDRNRKCCHGHLLTKCSRKRTSPSEQRLSIRSLTVVRVTSLPTLYADVGCPVTRSHSLPPRLLADRRVDVVLRLARLLVHGALLNLCLLGRKSALINFCVRCCTRNETSVGLLYSLRRGRLSEVR